MRGGRRGDKYNSTDSRFNVARSTHTSSNVLIDHQDCNFLFFSFCATSPTAATYLFSLYFIL